MRTFTFAIVAAALLTGCGEANDPRAAATAATAAMATTTAPTTAPTIARSAVQATPAVAADSSPRVDELATTYTHLTRMTPAPVMVDAGLAELCRGVTPRDVELAQQRLGPHVNTFVSIYMNVLAAGAFNQRARVYPVGSVIVKEKKAIEFVGGGHSGVGGMIKRAAGYDSEHGD